MKKSSLIKANCVIVAMFVALVGISISNSKSLKVYSDNRVIYQGNSESNNICLMINVYQGEEYVEDMLEIFERFNVKTTFFVGGSWAVRNVDLLKKIYSSGHEIGNHGFYHKDQDKLDFDSNLEEINLCHQVVLKNVGINMNLFAPPSGAYNISTVDAATSLNYSTIMWTHDTIDWRDQDENLIFKRATKNMQNGDLILMHPTKKSVQALTDILSYAINNGFNPSRVSDCL